VSTLPDETRYHLNLLVLSVVVLVLAGVLQVPGNDTVVLPFLSVPLPDACWFRRLTGIGCPGCGLTRCFICLAHGELARAWHFNPGGLAFFVLAVAQIPYRSIQIWRLRHRLTPWQPVKLSAGVLCISAAILFVQWLWRLAA
jgi:hypothetical protein